MSDPQNFNEVSRRIRTLTTILQALNARSEPTSHRENVPRFLRHFVTLLTCGDKHSPSAAKVMAATGRIESDGIARTLLVTQNPHLKSKESTLRVTKIHKTEKSFHDIVNGPADASSLEDHIADIWAVLEHYNNKRAQDKQTDFVALQRFVVMRCYRKISARFDEDRRLFDGHRLFDVIATWKPLEGEDNEAKLQPRWVPIPGVLAIIFPNLMPEEYRRDVDGQLQWKLSNKTSPLWVKLLGAILMALNRSIQKAEQPLKDVGCNSLTPAQSSAVADVAIWCNSLYIFVFWNEVLQDLLENTSLGEHLGRSLKFKDARNDENEDDTDLMPEPNEHPNKTVFRFLKTVVAWHAALGYLTNQRVSKLTTNFLVGLVTVPPGDKSILTVKELIPMYRRRLDPGDDKDVKRRIRVLEEHCKSIRFAGTVHAEASLMGLLVYEYHDRDKIRNNGDPIEGEDLLDDLLDRQLDTVHEIAVSKKCCWCCYRLAKLLQDRLPNEIGLPGTHGLVYAWNPPAVGIDVEVLTDLEDALWAELQKALSQNTTYVHSCQSSASSTASFPSTEGGLALDEDILNEIRLKFGR